MIFITNIVLYITMKSKKIGHIQRRINRRMLERNHTLQHIIIYLHTKSDCSSLQGLTGFFDENFMIQSMGRMKIGQTYGRISRRWLVCNRTIQYVFNLYTKYTYFSLLAFTEICDEQNRYSRYGKKENRINTGKI